MRIRSVLTHSGQAVLEGALIATMVVGVMAGTAFAGKPGGGSGGHHGSGGTSGGLTLAMVDDVNGNGLPNWGDTITFHITSTVTNPYVSLRCYQGTTLVAAADAGFYPSYPWPGAQNMPLSSPSWTGGTADCNVTLNGNAAMSFVAGS